MTSRRLSSFIDALAAGRRPGRFEATPEDVEVLRTAIALRAARPGDAIPDEAFVSGLYEELADQASPPVSSNVHPIRSRRVRTALVAVAASVALVGGTFIVTESFNNTPATTSAVAVPQGAVLRTGTFETASGTVLGQIVAYRGHPSWVYMNVGTSSADSSIMCRLQLDNGSIVSAGTIHLNSGIGQLTKSVRVNISRLRGAKLFAPDGTVLASATFD
jgi:hypothetical protein